MTPPTSTRAACASESEAGGEHVAASYESALAELEQLVGQLDTGQLPLDQLLSRYQRGAQLLAYCRERLEAVENQIQLFDKGELRPWSAT